MTELFNLILENTKISVTIPSNNVNYSNFRYIWQYSFDRILWKDTLITNSSINLTNNDYDKYLRCIISYDLSVNWNNKHPGIIKTNPKLNIRICLGIIHKYPLRNIFFISEKYEFERKLTISQNLIDISINEIDLKLTSPYSGTFKTDDGNYRFIQRGEIIEEPGVIFQKMGTELGVEKTHFITKNITSLEFKIVSYQWKKSKDNISWSNVTNNELALTYGILYLKDPNNILIPGDVVGDNGNYFRCLINYKNNMDLNKSFMVEMIEQVPSIIEIEYEEVSQNILDIREDNSNKNIVSNTLNNNTIVIGVEININDNDDNSNKDSYKLTSSNNTLIYDNDKMIIVTISNQAQNYSIKELLSFFNNDINFSNIFKLDYSYKNNKIIILNNSKENKYINFSKSTINELIGWFSDTKDILIKSGESISSLIQNPNPKLYTNISINNINSNIIEDNQKYSEKKIKYRQLINLKQDKWTNISLNNLNIRDDLIKYLKTFYIDEAYILDNNIYYDLFNSEYYDKYSKKFKQFINSINKYDYIDNNNLINDSCWIKKKAPLINCIIIGINYIGTNDELKGAIKDAENMATFMKNYYKDQINIIKMIESESDTSVDLIPTAKNIKQKLDNIVKENKNIIFYFAGHIFKTYKNSDSVELDNSDENMKTLKGDDNDEKISDDWFYTNFIKKMNPNIKCRIYIDSCYSCGFTDFKYQYVDKKNIKENLTLDDQLVNELNNSKIELEKVIELLGSLNNKLFNINRTIQNSEHIDSYSTYKASKLNMLNIDLNKIKTEIVKITADKNSKNDIYNQKVIQYNTNKSSNIAEVISISSSNEYTKTYENKNNGIFTTELLRYLNEYGNFNIINSFDILSTTNLRSTFIFNEEPILLL